MHLCATQSSEYVVWSVSILAVLRVAWTYALSLKKAKTSGKIGFAKVSVMTR